VTPKDALHDALQNALREFPSTPDGAVLTRWVLIAEVATPTDMGVMLLTKNGSASGERLTKWDVRGLLGEALAQVQPAGRYPEEPS
jgi:hypothetical protein